MVKNNKDRKIFKLLQSLSIYLMIACVAIVVVAVFGYIKMNSFLFTLIAILFVLALALSLCLPWAKRLTDKRLKILSIVFLSIIASCALCWIISIIMCNIIFTNVVKLDVSEAKFRSYLRMFAFIKFTLIYTVVIFIASEIAGNISKFGKEKLVLQILNALGYIVMGIVIIALLNIVTIRENAKELSDTFGISKGSIAVLKSKLLWMSFVMAVFIVAITNGLTKAQYARMQKNLADKEIYGQNNDYEIDKKLELSQTAKEEQKEDIEVKLDKLKSMLDNNIITQEEYDQKRKDIIDKM